MPPSPARLRGGGPTNPRSVSFARGCQRIHLEGGYRINSHRQRWSRTSGAPLAGGRIICGDDSVLGIESTCMLGDAGASASSGSGSQHLDLGNVRFERLWIASRPTAAALLGDQFRACSGLEAQRRRNRNTHTDRPNQPIAQNSLIQYLFKRQTPKPP